MKGRQRMPVIPRWLVGAVLYGCSWPLVEGINTSFLAWIAFVPLFRDLKEESQFLPFAQKAFGFVCVATLLQVWWGFFAVPLRIMPLAWAGGLQDSFLQAVPLLGLWYFKQRMTFRRALWLLVWMWPLWEWIYTALPLSLRFLMIGHSQASNGWLIQFIDVVGIWGMSAWVLALNAILFDVWQRAHAQGRVVPWRRMLVSILLMLGIPAAYGGWAYVVWQDEDAQTLDVTVLHTDYAPGQVEREETLPSLIAQTDTLVRAAGSTDVLVWPEGVTEVSTTHLPSAFRQALVRWDTPLVFGTSGVQQAESGTIRANRAALVEADTSATAAVASYDKIHLIPFWEGIPWYQGLRRIPGVEAYHAAKGYYTPGEEVAVLPLSMPTGDVLHLGTPICHEQSTPGLWASMARQGTDIFVQLSFESWFGDVGFQTAMANITRLRAIENRRAVVRASNGGMSAFYDPLGRLQAFRTAAGGLQHQVPVVTGTSVYSQFPYLFAIVAGMVSVFFLIRQRL